MKIKLATIDDKSALLALMQECHQYTDREDTPDWTAKAAALAILLGDDQAGQGYLIYDGQELAGYMIICRGFSLENGGYFSWVEETYLREPYHGHYRERLIVS